MTLSPLLSQHREIKKQYPDVILLFRVGAHYECFEQDARTAARVLELPLGAGEVPTCRLPVAGIDFRVLRLIGAGHRVALCDQVEQADRKPVRTRKTTRVVTP